MIQGESVTTFTIKVLRKHKMMKKQWKTWILLFSFFIFTKKRVILPKYTIYKKVPAPWIHPRNINAHKWMDTGLKCGSKTNYTQLDFVLLSTSLSLRLELKLWWNSFFAWAWHMHISTYGQTDVMVEEFIFM